MQKIKTHFRKNLFLYTMALSLLLPDIVLRALSVDYAPGALQMVPALFTLLWVAAIVLTAIGYLPRRWGKGLYLTIGIFFTAFMISGYIYFRIFNQFYWLDNIGMTGEAMDYTGYILSYVDIPLILAILFEIALLCVTVRFWPGKPCKASGLWLLLPVLGLATLHTFMMTDAVALPKASNTDVVFVKNVYRSFRDSGRCMQTAGAYQYVARNVARMVFPETEKNNESLGLATEYFAERPMPSENGMTGALSGKNVIMVMMESMDDWMIDEKYTPTIHHMMENGIDFTEHFSCTFGTGYTFNTEFTANTGYHALHAGTPAAFLSENAYPYSLASQFRKNGYSARSFHFNSPAFYNRDKMHEAFGYEEYVSFSDYMPKSEAQIDSKAIQNPDIYRAMVPDEGGPFFHFVITYSAHLPYTYEDEKLRSIKKEYPNFIDKSMDAELNHARILAHDTDEFFRVLLENLEKDGLLEDTVIIGFSDHFSYGLSRWEKLYRLGNVTTSDMLEKTPFFIYCKGFRGEKITKVTNSLDILPTVVNLFGLEKTPYWIGEDAFDPAYPGYAYFSGGAWYDGNLYCLPEDNGESLSPDMQDYVRKMHKKFALREQINEAVLVTDYFGEE